MMNLILNHLDVVIFLILVILGLISYLVKKGNIQKLLLYICIEAERKFGSKTGQIKLRHVYDWFIGKFPFLSLFISFEEFGKMVDKALEEMEKLIKSNKAIAEYVGRQ